jgi:hypothetical protein
MKVGAVRIMFMCYVLGCGQIDGPGGTDAADDEGATGSSETPASVLDKFNQATAAGGIAALGALSYTSVDYDLRWAMQHAAAGGACAAASPVADSYTMHIVIPHRAGRSCADSCMFDTDGLYTNCRTSIAIGQVRPTRATAYNQVVSTNYNYICGDSQQNYDEVMTQGLDSSYTAYCCCYQ